MFIRRHPSSLKDEMEVKMVKALVALIGIVLACFLVARAFQVAFPLILLGGFVGGGIAAWKIFTRAQPVVPLQTED